MGMAVIFIFEGCKKGEKKENQAPETLVVPREINVSGDRSLITKVHLFWMGTDPDGLVAGYEISVENGPVFFTEKSDSTFLFSIPVGSRYASVEVRIRARDNAGLYDPTPAVLRIPLKNSDPFAEFDTKFSSRDSALGVISLFWIADDPDGTDNLKSIQLKANNGNWITLDRNLRELHLVPQSGAAGVTRAKLYKDGSTALAEELDGLLIGDTNTLYLRAVDLANASGTTDTLRRLYLREKKGDLLYVSGDNTAFGFYNGVIKDVYPNFDILDLARDNGALQPAKWDPGFDLLIAQYDKVVFTTDNKSYPNAATGASNRLFESTAKSFLSYFNSGGKLFCIGFLSVDTTLGPNSPVFGAFPMERVSYSTGNVRLKNSNPALISKATGYPDFASNQISSKIIPFYPTSDATVLYTGDLDKRGGWTGPENLGAKRGIGGNTSQVFISVYLYDFAHEGTKLRQLFDHVLNIEFNW
jgi:hypothetical protein